MTLVVVGKDRAALASFDPAWALGAKLTLWPNLEGRSLASIGNEVLGATQETVVGLVHADTWFGPGAIDAFGAAADRGVVCGIAGRSLDGTYRWCGQNPGEVSTLDCCAVFLRKDLGLRFDEQLCRSVHFHAEDLCLQARQRRITIEVPKARAGHYGIGLRAGCPKGYMEAREVFERKWAGFKYRTT